MKIGILTFHSQLNYGGVLQAYALQESLKTLGHEVFIIDRWLDKDNSHLYGAQNKTLSIKEKLKKCIKQFLQIGHLGCEKRHKKTVEFIKTKLNLTSYSFFQWEDIKGQDLGVDLIIVGSDQVWNGGYNNPRPYLLLDAPSCPAISYAASFGMKEIPSDLIDVYRQGFSRFKAISCREAEGCSLVQNEGFSATHVVDPTLLLDPRIWSRFADSEIYERSTLVCYFLSVDIMDSLSILNEFAKKKKCQVKVFVDSWCRLPWQYRCNEYVKLLKILFLNNNIEICFSANPQDFLDAHASASWIITDSFHSLMFSSIFDKNVRVIRPSCGFRSAMFARIEEFQKCVTHGSIISDSLGDALYSFLNDEDIIFNQDRIATLRNQSMQWLQSAIESAT